MIYITLHLTAAICLLAFTFFGILGSHTNKLLGTVMTINRFLYVVLLATGLRLAFWTFSEHWLLTSIKCLTALALIGGIEMLGARKSQSRITWQQLIPVLILFITVTTLGFSLH